MQTIDETKLELFEEERRLSWTAYVKPMVLGLVFLAVVANVLASSIAQIGELKSQHTTYASAPAIDFRMKDMGNMLGVKFFANMTTSSVERSMDCYVGKNK